MKALIYRDIMLIAKSKVVYISFFLILLLLPQDLGISVLNKVSSSMVLLFLIYIFYSYITAYDYKYDGLKFSSTMPVSRREIVISRYLFLCITFIIYGALYAIIKGSIHYINGHEILTILSDLGRYFLLFSIFFSIVIPLYYKFGYMNMRWAMFCGMIVVGIGSGLLSIITSIINPPFLFFISLITGTIMLLLSSNLSCVFFSRKEF